MITRSVLALAAMILLAGCAIPYGDTGPAGRLLFNGGIDDLQLSESTYQITVSGNAQTSSDRVRDYVLLRASELALTHGYKNFQIASSADTGRTSIVADPGFSTTTTSATVMGTPNFASGYATSTTFGGPSIDTVFRPGLAVVVLLTNAPGIDAALINRQLAPKYGVTPRALKT